MVWLKVKSVARILAVSADTIYRLIHRGELRAKRIGGEYRIHPDALRAYERDGLPRRTPAPVVGAEDVLGLYEENQR